MGIYSVSRVAAFSERACCLMYKVGRLAISRVIRALLVVLYCNFRSLAFLGLLVFLARQIKIKFIATLLSAAKPRSGCKNPKLGYKPLNYS